MRNFVICLVLIFGVFNTIDGQKKADENLLIRNKVFDFGTVKSDTLLKARYYLINRGKTGIKINYVNPECSCTGYSVSNYHIKPNDSVYVDLTFDTKHKHGEQKIYTIISAETKTKMYKLTLKANVK